MPPLAALHDPRGWKNATNYPAQGASLHRFAAEFLIRDVAFQQALGELRAQWKETLADPHALKAARTDTGSPYRQRAREVAERFGLSHWSWIRFRGDEPIIYPRFKVAPYSLWSSVRFDGAPGEWFLGQDEGWGAAVVFDLRKPTAPQLAAAGRLLKRTQRMGVEPLRGLQRNRRANYQGMLRVLDARAASAHWSEIASVIYPRKEKRTAVDSVKKLHKRGLELLNGRYRDLPSLAR
jgi:hypothetical protein